MPVLGPTSGTPLAGDILTLAEAKQYLGITDSTHDAELPSFITAVTPLIETYIGGAVVPRTITEEIRADREVLFLTHPYTTGVTSVTEYSGGTATVLTAEDYDTEGTYQLRNGMLYRRSGWSDSWWTAGSTVRVVYTAGFDPVPEAIKKAAGETLRHLWSSTQIGAFGDTSLTGTFEGLPNLAKTLLAPWRRAPLVA